MRDWVTRMSEFCAYMRACSWHQPILVRGQTVRFLGVMAPRQARGLHYNDNRIKL